MFNIKKAERRECKGRTYPSTYFPRGDNQIISQWLHPLWQVQIRNFGCKISHLTEYTFTDHVHSSYAQISKYSTCYHSYYSIGSTLSQIFMPESYTNA